MKETCDVCGNFAGLETSPEGENCYNCDRWVCHEHAHFSDDDDPVPLCEDCYIYIQTQAEQYGEHGVYIN